MGELKLNLFSINTITLFCFINNIFGEFICSKFIECSKCTMRNDIMSDNICQIIDLYCKNNNNQIVFVDDKLKSYYIKHFYKNPELKNICGKQNFYINEPNFEKIIEFGKKQSYYLNKTSICCNYEFENNLDNNYDIYLSIYKIMTDFDEVNLYYELFIHLPNSTILNIFGDYYKEKIINLNNIKSFFLMIDIYGQPETSFLKKNYYKIEDLKIKIYVNNINNSNKDYNITITDSNSNSKNYTIIYIFLIGGGTLLLSILLFIKIYKYVQKKRLVNNAIENNNRSPIRNNNSNMQQIRNNLNRHEININKEKENKRKIDILFISILFPIKYSKEIFQDNNTSCSICLENYIDQKSLISLTPCNHIFHFKCLKKWSLKNRTCFRCPNCNYNFIQKKDLNNPIISNNNNDNNINNVNINNNYDNNANLDASELRVNGMI